MLEVPSVWLLRPEEARDGATRAAPGGRARHENNNNQCSRTLGHRSRDDTIGNAEESVQGIRDLSASRKSIGLDYINYWLQRLTATSEGRGLFV